MIRKSVNNMHPYVTIMSSCLLYTQPQSADLDIVYIQCMITRYELYLKIYLCNTILYCELAGPVLIQGRSKH